MPDSLPAVPQPRVPAGPSVRFESRVTSGIALEVFTAFRAQPPSGNEAGGLLLGTRSGDPVVVTDFEPVLCEYKFGPFYALSEDDLSGLDESIQWFQTPEAGELRVLGFYRSHARPEPSFDERDEELMRRFLGEPGSLFLLLKPGRGEAITAELFVWSEGKLVPTGHPMLFPSDGAISAVRTSAPVVPTPAELAPAAPPPPTIPVSKPVLPPSRPRPVDPPTQEVGGRDWRWVAAVIILTLAAAVLGYRSVVPSHADSPQETAPSAPKPSQSPASTPAPPSAIPPGTRVAVDTAPLPAIQQDTEQGIRDALARWERALLSGDPDLIAQCYENAPPDDASNATAQTIARFGKPAILRISELTLTPVSDGRAIASFRKHWQTSGPRIFAGEEQEKITFVKTADSWKIASEVETKVYWRQGPRA